jgi:hypothetical protein
MVATVLAPYFNGARDTYVAFSPEPGMTLEKLAKTQFVVDAKNHNSGRHFASTRDDGMLMVFAPQLVQLPVETLIAILAHEFGHAADFAYPAHWLTRGQPDDRAKWIGDPSETKQARKWRRLWYDQNDHSGRDGNRDRIEWRADAIAFTVTGNRLGYCGDCLLQCFNGGIERPPGLR